MNKLVIFDLDGVLIESRELHYHSLNDALRSIDTKYVISRDEHLSIYDGLNTTRKLKLLSESKGLPAEYHDMVWQRKQLATFELIKQFPRDEKLVDILSEFIKQIGYNIDRIILEQKLETYNNHLNLALREIFCQ